jgi:F0F1-type ATP synthase assembly protein I
MPRFTGPLGQTTSEGWTHFSTLVAGIGVYGAIGFGLDQLFGTRPILFMIGLLGGCAGGVYLVWIRATQNASRGSGRNER